MKIYFAGAILGGRDNLPVYEHIVGRLKALGHTVPSEHVARRRVLEEEAALTPQAVFERDVRWIRESDAMIAEVSTPSLGVGYEIACAVHLGMRVLCVYRAGLAISKMITGNDAGGLVVAHYRDEAELDQRMDMFLKG